MPLPKFYKVVQDQQGNIVPQVLGSVFNHGTAVLASLYQDDAGTIPLSNPMTSDAQYGSFKFYVNPGHYDLSFTKPGYTFEPIDDLQVPADTVTLGTMATQNADAVAITGGSATFTAPVQATQFQTLNPPGNNLAALYSTMNAAGGTNRWAVECTGDAPSYLGGSLHIANSTVGILRPPQADVTLAMSYQKSGRTAIACLPTDNDVGASAAIHFYNVGGTTVGYIHTTATTTSYTTSSDVRLKRAIAPLAGALDVLAALRPVTFRWNSTDEADIGFLAHELMVPVPTAVTGQPDEINLDGSVKPQQVDHSKLVPWLTAACQELAQQVQALTQRVTSLEEQLGL